MISRDLTHLYKMHRPARWRGNKPRIASRGRSLELRRARRAAAIETAALTVLIDTLNGMCATGSTDIGPLEAHDDGWDCDDDYPDCLYTDDAGENAAERERAGFSVRIGDL